MFLLVFMFMFTLALPSNTLFASTQANGEEIGTAIEAEPQARNLKEEGWYEFTNEYYAIDDAIKSFFGNIWSVLTNSADESHETTKEEMEKNGLPAANDSMFGEYTESTNSMALLIKKAFDKGWATTLKTAKKRAEMIKEGADEQGKLAVVDEFDNTIMWSETKELGKYVPEEGHCLVGSYNYGASGGYWQCADGSDTPDASTRFSLTVNAPQEIGQEELGGSMESDMAPDDSSLQMEKTTIHNGELGTDIPVNIMVPKEMDKPVPLVVFCHGFTGNKNGDGHFAKLARTLASNGVATVALDFPGNGERQDEPFTDYTLANMQSDVRAVISEMQSRHSINSERIGLLGHSMGGRLVTSCLDPGVLPVTVRAAALWSPANGDGLRGLEFLAPENSDDAAKMAKLDRLKSIANGSGWAPTRWGVNVSSDLFNQVAAHNPSASISQYSGALLMSYTGAADEALFSSTTIESMKSALQSRSGTTVDLTTAFPNADHNYQSDAAAAVQIESSTVKFFLDNLFEEGEREKKTYNVYLLDAILKTIALENCAEMTIDESEEGITKVGVATNYEDDTVTQAQKEASEYQLMRRAGEIGGKGITMKDIREGKLGKEEGLPESDVGISADDCIYRIVATTKIDVQKKSVDIQRSPTRKLLSSHAELQSGIERYEYYWEHDHYEDYFEITVDIEYHVELKKNAKYTIIQVISKGLPEQHRPGYAQAVNDYFDVQYEQLCVLYNRPMIADDGTFIYSSAMPGYGGIGGAGGVVGTQLSDEERQAILEYLGTLSGNLSPLQQRIVDMCQAIISSSDPTQTAKNFGIGVVNQGCQKFIADMYHVAGQNPRVSAPTATDAGTRFIVDTSPNNIPDGAAVYATSPYGSAGHVGVYVGGHVIDAIQINGVEIVDISTFAEWQASGYGYRGWGFNGANIAG